MCIFIEYRCLVDISDSVYSGNIFFFYTINRDAYKFKCLNNLSSVKLICSRSPLSLISNNDMHLQGEEMGDCWRHVTANLQVGTSDRAQVR